MKTIRINGNKFKELIRESIREVLYNRRTGEPIKTVENRYVYIGDIYLDRSDILYQKWVTDTRWGGMIKSYGEPMNTNRFKLFGNEAYKEYGEKKYGEDFLNEFVYISFDGTDNNMFFITQPLRVKGDNYATYLPLKHIERVVLLDKYKDTQYAAALGLLDGYEERLKQEERKKTIADHETQSQYRQR